MANRDVNKRINASIQSIEVNRLLKIIYFNARSIKTKMEELNLTVQEKKPDIIVIVESWLNEDILDSEIKLQNFEMVRIDRKCEVKQRGRGVLIYINQIMKYITVESEKLIIWSMFGLKYMERDVRQLC